MRLFVDASALVKLYVTEDGSETMRDIAGRSERWGGLFVSDHVALEVVSTLGAKMRGGGITVDEYLDALHQFDLDYPDAFLVVEVSPAQVEQAMVMGRRFHDSGTKTMDLLHAVCAVHISQVEEQGVIMVTADRGLRALALRVGCDVFDPCRDDLAVLALQQFPLT